MITVCAWCEAEGRRNVLRETSEPYDMVSHGICPEHYRQVVDEIMDECQANVRAGLDCA